MTVAAQGMSFSESGEEELLFRSLCEAIVAKQIVPSAQDGSKGTKLRAAQLGASRVES
jgi:hypothetical protein